MTVVAADVGGLFAVAFPAPWLRVYQPLAPMTGREFLAAHPEAVACVDGSMFGFCAGEPHDYNLFSCGSVDYGFFDGVTRALQRSRYPGRGGTVIVEGSRARAASGWRAADLARADLAWQGYPELVRDGAVVQNPASDAGRTARAGAGILADGRVCFGAMTAPMHAFALAARAIGATDFFYGDGGGSACVAVRVPGGVAVEPAGGLDSRRVPSFLAAVSPAYWMAYGLPRRR